MIRDDREVALNDVHATLLSSADRYHEAGRLASAEQSDWFFELARKRTEQAVQLEWYIRRGGDLPNLPDADRTALEEIGTALRSALAAHPDQVLGKAVLWADRRVSEAIEAVPTLEDDREVNGFLRSVRDHLERDRRRTEGRLSRG